jgi:hypothetical protein
MKRCLSKLLIVALLATFVVAPLCAQTPTPSEQQRRNVPHVDSNILTAVFTLIGVIVGGGITAGANYILEERRANREKSKEQRARMVELKRAARLIEQDFNWILGVVNVAIEQRRWVTVEAVQVDTWREQRSVLAAETSYEAWLVLKKSSWAMESYRRAAAAAIAQGEQVIDEDEMGLFERLQGRS